ncbi:hypothetical protein BFJ63_vAg14389 [Fusarium oxysporum f. sp. narcissi]|uniref:Uncharacterized protein n=1 Tax=Fusarium oxysporum f. sp. narcissi TaxID=451672 RepID=A0A4Q2VEZ7_FUSOX|nr:hypothetical protein BFJ63_vAg14389 [Fusarium oxysporum f. sp. narcissi]
MVDPPRNDDIPHISRQEWPSNGNNYLFIFPTKNKDKIQALNPLLDKEKPEYVDDCFSLVIPVPDDGCSQPCNGEGYNRLRDRIIKAMAIFQCDHPTYLQDNHIGVTIVAGIESFFQRENVPRPVGAAIVGMFNVSTGTMVTATSIGVTLNEWFLEEAERVGGLVEGRKDCLRTTGGEILGRRFPGVDHADWHKHAVGKPRKDFFQENINDMSVPWV